MTARQTIHLSLVSLKNSPKLRKELHKPALFDSRQKMGLLLKNERKFDISGEWKSRESFTLKSCKPEERKKGTQGSNGGRGKNRSQQKGQQRSRQQKRFTLTFLRNEYYFRFQLAKTSRWQNWISTSSENRVDASNAERKDTWAKTALRKPLRINDWIFK